MKISTPHNFLESIRVYELRPIIEILKDIAPERARILEIGAGTGWQARELTAHGYQVSAIDIPTSNHSHAREWDVIDFDGRHIPFDDQTFDIIYSSNVIEHVEDLNSLNREMHRVLRPTGSVVHYVPTSSWRAWSLLAFYPSLLRDIFAKIVIQKNVKKKKCHSDSHTNHNDLNTDKFRINKIFRRLTPHTHGSVGTCVTELFRYRRSVWTNFFQVSGWTVQIYTRNRLFLTGEMLLGKHLSTRKRAKLSRFIGSTAHLFILKRKDKNAGFYPR